MQAKPENPQRMMFRGRHRGFMKSSKESAGKRNPLISEMALLQRPRADSRRCLHRIGLNESHGEERSQRQ